MAALNIFLDDGGVITDKLASLDAWSATTLCRCTAGLMRPGRAPTARWLTGWPIHNRRTCWELPISWAFIGPINSAGSQGCANCWVCPHHQEVCLDLASLAEVLQLCLM